MSSMGQGLSNMNGGMPMGMPQEYANDNRKINFSNNHDGSATKKTSEKITRKKEGKVDVNKKD